MDCKRLRIRVKLLQAVRDMNERHTGEHEPLVTGGQIFQQVFRFGAHLLQVIGNGRGEIVLPVLPLLPSGYVRFHAEDSGLCTSRTASSVGIGRMSMDSSRFREKSDRSFIISSLIKDA